MSPITPDDTPEQRLNAVLPVEAPVNTHMPASMPTPPPVAAPVVPAAVTAVTPPVAATVVAPPVAAVTTAVPETPVLPVATPVTLPEVATIVTPDTVEPVPLPVATPPVDDTDIDDTVDILAGKPQAYIQTEPCFKDEVDYIDDCQLQLPSQTTEHTLKPIKEALNMELREDDRTKNWAYTLSRGHSKNTMSGALRKGLFSGDWRQSVPSDKGELSGGVVKANNVSNCNLYGKDAMLRLLSHIGGSGNYETPLWHTGIWINLDPVTNADILELFRILNEDKIKLGRYTNGAVFSNTSAYTTKRVMDFILSKVGETTYRPAKNETMDLANVISINDIPTLVLALCNSMYPNGFKHNRACVYNPKSCHHTYSGTVDFDKLLWTDISALSKAQIRVMATACNGQVDKRALDSWAVELDRPDSRVLTLKALSGAEVMFTLRVPSYSQYVDSGQTWLDGIANTIGDSIEIEELDERNKYIDDNARATVLRQYTHYVESITFGDANIISDEADIEDALNALSADSMINSGLLKGITDFIDDTVLSVVGIPTYECPECNGGQTDVEKGIYKHILPLDMLELFFLILIDRVKKIKMTDI